VIPLGAEVPKIALLILATAVAFVLTRGVAAYERAQQRRDAATWADRGAQALRAGRLPDAITAYRRAVAKDRGDQRYELALADALARDGQAAAATQVLLVLREESPGDRAVNLQLARLAARGSDVDAADRYYRAALYAPASDSDDPLAIRLELAQYLLDRGRRPAAVSQLVAAAAQLPKTTDVAVRLGQLFLRGGDAGRAMDEFRVALGRDPGNADALKGAGTAAFRLARYADALAYLRRVTDPAVADMRMVSSEIVERDPLAPRIGARTRQLRAQENLTHVADRLMACRNTSTDDEQSAALDQAVATIMAAQQERGADRDALEDAVAAAGVAEQTLANACGPGTVTDRALTIIASLHSQS
jgi:tetratricopeptide (TPR) repeat protein